MRWLVAIVRSARPEPGGGSRSARLPAGRYDLSVELKGRSKPANQRLGTLVVDAHGAMEMLP